MHLPGAGLMAEDGSTTRLVQLCAGYFLTYLFTGVAVKYFQGSADAGLPGMHDVTFLVYSTAGGMGICALVVVALGWWRFPSTDRISLLGLSVPRELLYIVPSGLCTAVVIPTTTMMYSLPITVMVAMVIMRGSIIVVSRLVDAIQIHQGILTRRVYWEENAGVVLALAAVSVHLIGEGAGGFDFLSNATAVSILGAYIVAYALRIYVMNYFKNTRTSSSGADNRNFFAAEQLSAMVFAALGLGWFLNTGTESATIARAAIVTPHADWAPAIGAGAVFGVVAFFSVFIFMFKGRTATFVGLVNRLTSLIAGTGATLVVHFVFGGKAPKLEDWVSLAIILAAVALLTRSERRRAAELQAEKLRSA